MELFKMWLISWNQAFYNVYKDNISISMFFWANTVGQRPPAIYIYIGMYICWFASCGGETISVYSDHRCSATQNRVPVPSVTFELSSAQWWALPSWRPHPPAFDSYWDRSGEPQGVFLDLFPMGLRRARPLRGSCNFSDLHKGARCVWVVVLGVCVGVVCVCWVEFRYYNLCTRIREKKWHNIFFVAS
jgi:hypothetical protein